MDLRTIAASELRLSAATIDWGRTYRSGEREQQNHNIAECLHRKAPGYLDNQGVYNTLVEEYHPASILSTNNIVYHR